MEHTLKDLREYVEKMAIARNKTPEQVFDLLITKEYIDYTGLTVTDRDKKDICREIHMEWEKDNLGNDTYEEDYQNEIEEIEK